MDEEWLMEMESSENQADQPEHQYESKPTVKIDLTPEFKRIFVSSPMPAIRSPTKQPLSIFSMTS
jgi:hypothetical protein